MECWYDIGLGEIRTFCYVFHWKHLKNERPRGIMNVLFRVPHLLVKSRYQNSMSMYADLHPESKYRTITASRVCD